jgi:inositol 1,4,5-triphosphate receptor type 1/inositol 1,4,5-triphosphate receptor type 3
VERRRVFKREKKELVNLNPLEMIKKLSSMMGKLTNVLNITNTEEEEEDDDEDDQFDSQIDDAQMYTNPLMRGFIFLNNKLENANNEDSNLSPIEIELKLKICDILDHFLNMR